MITVNFLTFAAAFVLFQSCISSPTAQMTKSALEAKASATDESQMRIVTKTYELRPSLPERLQQFSSEPKSVDIPTGEKKSAADSATSSEISAALVKNPASMRQAIVLMLRSERWQDLLDESANDWNRCLSEGELSSERCRTLGHVRAVAFTRLGHLRDALLLYETLSSQQLTSQDALIFAGLLYDAGSARLCARLAGIGLQWDPADHRSELFALQAKCLRLDGQAEQARTTVTRALGEYPDLPSLKVESALLFLSERNLTQGCELLERLYLQEFRDVAVFYNWGKCLVGRRDSASARNVLKNARTHWPSERLWLLLSGEVSFLEGNANAARRDGLDYLAAAPAGDIFRPYAERLIRNAQGE
ncbi:MAG: hypothetical protein RLZZ488_165 [Pseudomonadota bacterium]|jgi:tetratricopeptide (TPR) repeat protein